VKQRAKILLDRREPGIGFIDRPQIGAVGQIEGRQRPFLGAEPGIVALGPRLLCRGEPPSMAEEKVRESMPRAQVDCITTDLLCMRLCVEPSHGQRNPREMQSRGRSFHMI